MSVYTTQSPLCSIHSLESCFEPSWWVVLGMQVCTVGGTAASLFQTLPRHGVKPPQSGGKEQLWTGRQARLSCTQRPAQPFLLGLFRNAIRGPFLKRNLHTWLYSDKNPSLCVCLAAKRRPVHCDPAGWDAARHRLRHEIPRWYELCAPGPGCPRVQGVRLWPLAFPGGRYIRPHVHERFGEEGAHLFDTFT